MPSGEDSSEVMLTKLEVVSVVRVEDGGQDVGVLLGLCLYHHARHSLETSCLILINLSQSVETSQYC